MNQDPTDNFQTIGFVMIRNFSDEELKTLLKREIDCTDCCFLRWPHKVSGFCSAIHQDCFSPEGQVFNTVRELRWRPLGTGFSVLLLSLDQREEDPFNSFKPVGETWHTQDLEAHVPTQTETRFLRGLSAAGKTNFHIGQRYFIDPKTATIHFVALTGKRTNASQQTDSKI